MMGLDLCPRCGAYASPMVWLGKDNGWICDDSYDKEVKANEHNSSGNHSDNMCNIGGAELDGQQ